LCEAGSTGRLVPGDIGFLELLLPSQIARMACIDEPNQLVTRPVG
jgi:hypothetical protein